MKSKINYILIIFVFSPLLLLSQYSNDSIPPNIQTSKGGGEVRTLPFDEDPIPQEVMVKSETQKKAVDSPNGNKVKPLEVQIEPREKPSTPVGELQYILEMDLEEINMKLASDSLEYRERRILMIKKEEAEYDLSFLKRLAMIKETIAYETTGNSESFIISADQFLDTLYSEETNVSDKFKDLSQERYDNYLVKDKILKLRINDIKVELVRAANQGDKLYKYSGFAILPQFRKRVRLVFYSDSFIRKADEKLMYEVAKVDDIERTMTIEGVISGYRHGRSILIEGQPLSVVDISEWIIVDREELIRDFRKPKKTKQ